MLSANNSIAANVPTPIPIDSNNILRRVMFIFTCSASKENIPSITALGKLKYKAK